MMTFRSVLTQHQTHLLPKHLYYMTMTCEPQSALLYKTGHVIFITFNSHYIVI